MTYPQCNDIRGHGKSIIDPIGCILTSDLVRKWMASGKDLDEFLKDEARREGGRRP